MISNVPPLTDEGVLSFIEELKTNRDIHSIYLHFCYIGNEGAEAIAEVLKVNNHLHSINLGQNEIEDEGASAIAAALRVNHGLHRLTLDHNKIHKQGIKAIISALEHNDYLLHLNVHSNHFNLMSPPHAKIYEDQIEALLHGNSFYHFHMTGTKEDSAVELHNAKLEKGVSHDDL